MADQKLVIKVGLEDIGVKSLHAIHFALHFRVNPLHPPLELEGSEFANDFLDIAVLFLELVEDTFFDFREALVLHEVHLVIEEVFSLEFLVFKLGQFSNFQHVVEEVCNGLFVLFEPFRLIVNALIF
jgi:hypothetical protein